MDDEALAGSRAETARFGDKLLVSLLNDSIGEFFLHTALITFVPCCSLPFTTVLRRGETCIGVLAQILAVEADYGSLL
jgi:hypothetical protein